MTKQQIMNFISDNRFGWFKMLKNTHRKLYDYVDANYNGAFISEKFYRFLNNKKDELFLCRCCSNAVTFRTMFTDTPYHDFCSTKCAISTTNAKNKLEKFKTHARSSKINYTLTEDDLLLADKIFKHYSSSDAPTFRRLYFILLNLLNRDIRDETILISHITQYLSLGRGFIYTKLLLTLGENAANTAWSKRSAALKKSIKKSMSIEGYTERYGSLENGLLMKQKHSVASIVNFSKASKESLLIFIPLYKFCRRLNISRNDIQLGIGGSREFYISDTDNRKTYSYDFTIKSLKFIIEYNGEAFHPNKMKMTENQFNAWKNPFGKSAAVVFDAYTSKLNSAKNRGFTVLELWSSNSVLYNIELCKTELNKLLV